jgi:uncharacterized membrane protein YbjE (DUF340 family)
VPVVSINNKMNEQREPTTLARDLMSRKFIVTMTAMGLTVLLAFHGKMDANVGLVLAAGIGAYNWANLRQSQNGSAPKP